MRRALPIILLAALAVAGGGFAQELVDRIVAVVDKNPVLASDVDAALSEEVYVRRLRGEPLPADSAGLTALRDELLQGLIERRIVIAKAKKESVEVSATEIEDGLDQWLSDLIKAAGSEAAFSQELARQGFAVADLKDRYRKDIEEQLVVSKFMRKQFGAIAVSDNELAGFFRDKYDSIPSLPEVVGIAHIVIAPQISPSEETQIAEKVDRVLDRVRRGEAFEKVAREMSDDEATRAKGGEIGAVALSDLQPDIAAAAAKLAVGQVSDPFRTGLGIEILKLDDRQGDTYRLRHVFVKFAAAAEDTAKALGLAEEIQGRLSGGEAFESLARKYSEDASTRENGGYLGEIETSALDTTYRDAIAALNPGEISHVIKTPLGFQILKLVSRTAARKPSYDEAKLWIKNLIESRKREEQFAKWLDAARHDIYVKKLQ
jgi:peptidyl-prolyl cis-trans isomerase SurA